MARRQKLAKFIEKLEITSAGAEGHSIGRVDNQVVFVKYAAPGDVVDVRVVQKKKKFMEGQIVRFHEKSTSRIEPFCEYFTLCGGCKWQHLSYQDQLAFKQQQVIDSMQRLGGIEEFQVMPIAGCEQTQGYRNKLELTFSEKSWVAHFDKENPTEKPPALGFHIPGQFSKILDIEKCHLMPDFVNQIQRSLKEFCVKQGYSFHDIQLHEGLMRTAMFRCNSNNEWMVLVSFYYRDEEAISAVMNHLKSTFMDSQQGDNKVVSLVYVVNTKMNDSLQGTEVDYFAGDAYLTETLGDKKYKIQPLSFFQTNSAQAKVLYDITRDFAGLTGTELVYDLYTGTGSIALYVSDKAKKVVGIEYVEAAIEDAKVNSQWNSVENCEFFAGDMKDILTSEFIAHHGKPNVIITDPPREGMHPDVVNRILESEPNRIVYVSCNPATQARDAKLLSEKYRLVKIQPVDMFPHTHHVENVALFERL